MEDSSIISCAIFLPKKKLEYNVVVLWWGKEVYRTVGTRVDIKDNDNKNDNDKTRKLGEIVIVSYNHKTSYMSKFYLWNKIWI